MLLIIDVFMFIFKVFMPLAFIFCIYFSNFVQSYYTALHTNLTTININARALYKEIQRRHITKLAFLPKYYSRNELIFGDGFLIDFLQKKSVDL